MKRNLTVVEASAGTGKTFKLVTRMLSFLVKDIMPEEIVALTFSRAAAGEIFNSFVDRLARAASSEENAAEESERLKVTKKAADYARYLRLVISRQHLSMVGTLDSFLMRVVRALPFELGLEGDLRMMSEYRSPVETMRIVGEMMRNAEPEKKKLFRLAFSMALRGPTAKKYLQSFGEFINDWHRKFIDMGGVAADVAWGKAEGIWRDGGATPDDAEVVSKLDETRGIFYLMTMFEAVYQAKIRGRGLLVFDDIPRLINRLGNLRRLDLEYRMDAKFSHWALDEFQDTSREQWKALENLLDEAEQRGDEKSVFIVGDRKQAIYGWRNGDVRILGREAEVARREGNWESLDESRRYCKEISSTVNSLFAGKVIPSLIDMDGVSEEARWKCPEHRSFDKETEGFVHVLVAEKQGSRLAKSDFFLPILRELQALRPWERGISSAVLTRDNDLGSELAAYLKEHGISQVVFEGDSCVLDTPVLRGFVGLIKLAEHPSDELSYNHIAMSPLKEALWPDGMPSADELSASLLEDFAKFGIARKFGEVRERLKSVPDSWDRFTDLRFTEMLKAAAEFEEMQDESTRLSDFGEFLAKKMRRDFAEPGMVKIMTMHKSKGLGFDHVIVPFYEFHKFVDDRRPPKSIGGAEGEWILSYPGRSSCNQDDELRHALARHDASQIYERVCLDYVALTRAKRALTIVIMPPTIDQAKAIAKGKTIDVEKFSDVVRTVLGPDYAIGNPNWYENFKPEDATAEPEQRLPGEDVERGKREVLARRNPSRLFHEGMNASELFAEVDSRADALRRGTEVHAEFEAIEWVDASAAKDDFDRALVKPANCVDLWRERSYELVIDGAWESGQFDRVVFTREGDETSAIVYDFKTNAKGKSETIADFESRMRRDYTPQLSAYRRAITALTGIPSDRIKTILLCTSTRTSIEV